MKRMIVIGCPGSGKSTFSRALHERAKIPLFHLDMMYWNADRTTVSKETFLERLSDVMKGEEWIIDGNYASTLELRISACDTVFFLDLPTKLCLEGVRQRRGAPRADMPWVETEEDGEFMEFIASYNQTQRPLVIQLLEKYSDKDIFIITDREQADGLLSRLF